MLQNSASVIRVLTVIYSLSRRIIIIMFILGGGAIIIIIIIPLTLLLLVTLLLVLMLFPVVELPILWARATAKRAKIMAMKEQQDFMVLVG